MLTQGLPKRQKTVARKTKIYRMAKAEKSSAALQRWPNSRATEFASSFTLEEKCYVSCSWCLFIVLISSRRVLDLAGYIFQRARPGAGSAGSAIHPHRHNLYFEEGRTPGL